MSQHKLKPEDHTDEHEFGWNEEAGVCLDCGLIHDCRVEFKFEMPDNEWRCEVCHAYVDEALEREIEEENAEARLLEADHRRAIHG